MLGEVLTAFFVTLVITSLLVGVLNWRHPAAASPLPTALFTFFILFLIVWAGGVWLSPMGPSVWGVSWVGYAVIGVITALLLLAVAAPSRPPRAATNPVEEVEEAAVFSLVFGVFFWILLVALIVTVAARFLI